MEILPPATETAGNQQVAPARATKPDGKARGSSSAVSGAEMYGDVCTITIQKPQADSRCGVKLGETKDGSWVIVGAVERGSLADRFPEFRSGARITGIRGGGQAHSRPTLRQAAALFATATGDIEVSFKPLLDRFGFICAMDEFSARIETRDQVRQQNDELRKWQRRVGSVQNWKTYSARKPDKLRMRIQQGVPDPVRGFVWKAMAAARSPMGFRKHGLYQQLLEQVHTGPDPAGSRLGAAFEQVDKDVPRTMTGHIYFRSRDRIGQKALTRVLKAYAVFDPTLGYTQGMSSYAAVLLLYMREEDAFWVFATLMQSCGLDGLYLDGFPLLHQYYDTWELLLRRTLPRVSAHIQATLAAFLGLGKMDYAKMVKAGDPMRFALPGMYATPWLQSMLIGGNSPAPSALAPRIMDNLLLDGNLRVVFSLCLAQMKWEQRELCSQPAEELAQSLKTLPTRMGTGDRTADQLLEAAFGLQIKPRSIDPRPATVAAAKQ